MSETQVRELFSRHSDTAEPPLSPGLVSRSVDAGRRRLRRRRAARAATGGLAAFAALVIGASVMVGGGGGPPVRVPAEQAMTEPRDAVSLLERVSFAAGQRRLDLRDDQFIYEKRYFVTRLPVADPAGGGVTNREVSGHSERWISVDGTRPGWHNGLDKLSRPYGMEWPPTPEPSLREPTYKFLTTLPTDPDALLALVRAELDGRPGAGKPRSVTDADQNAFDVIGSVLNQTMLPPQLAAALYQAAAKIPGVTLIPDAADAAGRPGIAVSRSSAVSDSTAKWIFKKDTYEFLGASVDHSKISSDVNFAIITRTVVDRARQTP